MSGAADPPNHPQFVALWHDFDLGVCCFYHCVIFPHWPELEEEYGTCGSMGGYFLPLLFPKHFVLPPSRSWHQKPFWGSNLREEENSSAQDRNLTEKLNETYLFLDYKIVFLLPLTRSYHQQCMWQPSQAWRRKMTWPINTVNVYCQGYYTVYECWYCTYQCCSYVDISLSCRWTEEKTIVTADRSSRVGWMERCKYCSLCASVGEQKLVQGSPSVSSDMTGGGKEEEGD